MIDNVCLLACPNQLSFLLFTISNKLSTSLIHPSIIGRTSNVIVFIIVFTRVQSPHPCAGSHLQRRSSGSGTPPQPPLHVHCMHIHLFNKVAVSKDTKKSLIHENADANINCDFGDGDISRSRSRLPHTRSHR